MTAVWLRARSELRSRLAAVLALAVIVGAIGGVVIAAAAGARRTQSAYPRLLQASNALDVVADVTSPDPALGKRLYREITHFSQVATFSRVELATGQLQVPGQKSPGDVFNIVSPDGRIGTTMERFKMLSGRTVNPAATDEIVPSFSVADDLGLHVGQTVRLVYGGLFVNGSPGQVKGPAPVTLHVVGIGAAPGMFQPIAGGYLPGVLYSAGFYRAHHAFIQTNDWSAAVVFRHGFADYHLFRRAVKQLKRNLPRGTNVHLAFDQFQQTVGVQQATRTQAISLWVLAGLVALAGLAIFAQALGRQTFLESIEYPTLRSLGVSPAQLFGLGMIRAAVTGLMGAVVAVGVGGLLSPLTPLSGIARIAEPHPGFAFDGVALGVGAAALILLVGLLGAIPAWRSSLASGTALGTAELASGKRPSAVAAFMARASFPPSSSAGVRMALEPGRGRTAVPVRTAMFGAALSLFALAAALSFGASLNKLVTTPGLSGWNWDTLVFCCGNKHIGPHKSELLGKRFDAALAHSPQVTGYSFGTLGGVKVGGIGVTGLAMDPRKGSVEPSLVEGHLPEGTDQILLGTKTMDTLGVSMGDTVPVTGQTGTYRMRVVGGVASPPFFFSFTGPGQGAAFSVAAEERILGGHLPPDDGAYFIRFAPGTNGQAFLGNLRHRIPGSFVVPQPPSGQVNNLRGISNVPLVLAGIVALMAAATLAHTLITSIRRRRLDFAILKTLGFERRQVSAAVAWQATALSLVALAVGLPLGVMSGRLTWHVFSSRLGVVPDAVVPLFAVLMAIPAAIIVANLLAVIPGRIASRLKAASVMRSE